MTLETAPGSFDFVLRFFSILYLFLWVLRLLRGLFFKKKGEGVVEYPELKDEFKKLLLKEKPTPEADKLYADRREFLFGSLSHILNHKAPVMWFSESSLSSLVTKVVVLFRVMKLSKTSRKKSCSQRRDRSRRTRLRTSSLLALYGLKDFSSPFLGSDTVGSVMEAEVEAEVMPEEEEEEDFILAVIPMVAQILVSKLLASLLF